jgi:hypothetical protein
MMRALLIAVLVSAPQALTAGSIPPGWQPATEGKGQPSVPSGYPYPPQPAPSSRPVVRALPGVPLGWQLGTASQFSTWHNFYEKARPSTNIEDFRIPPDANFVLVFHKPTGEEFIPPRGAAYDGYGYKTGDACVAAGNKAIEAYPTLTFQCADLGFLRHLFDKLGK